MEYNKIIDLKDFGINNLAFDLPTAISYMCESVCKGKRILGGDIVICENGIWVESCDNWYTTKALPIDTLIESVDYLTMYYKNNSSCNWMVTVVLGD